MVLQGVQKRSALVAGRSHWKREYRAELPLRTSKTSESNALVKCHIHLICARVYSHLILERIVAE